MKKYLITLLLGTLFSSNIAFAEHSTYEIKGTASHIRYSETVNNAFFMRDKGYMLGIEGAWRYTGNDWLWLAIEASFSSGKVDYQSNGTGSMKGNADLLADTRILMGYQMKGWTPYSGFGYRYLQDDSRNKVSTTGATGYLRRANYFYIPLGVTAPLEYYISGIQLFDGWHINAFVEYDLFVYGLQKSYVGATGPLNNDQYNGWGARASVQFVKEFESLYKLVLEPYVKHWHIDDSFPNCTVGGGFSICGLEPDNKSTEFGVKIGIVI